MTELVDRPGTLFWLTQAAGVEMADSRSGDLSYWSSELSEAVGAIEELSERQHLLGIGHDFHECMNLARQILARNEQELGGSRRDRIVGGIEHHALTQQALLQLLAHGQFQVEVRQWHTGEDDLNRGLWYHTVPFSKDARRVSVLLVDDDPSGLSGLISEIQLVLGEVSLDDEGDRVFQDVRLPSTSEIIRLASVVDGFIELVEYWMSGIQMRHPAFDFTWRFGQPEPLGGLFESIAALGELLRRVALQNLDGQV